MKNYPKLIGRMTVFDPKFELNMQDAINCDCEEGAPWLSETKGRKLMDNYPTIFAMAQLIEKERDQLKAKLKRLQKKVKRNGT